MELLKNVYLVNELHLLVVTKLLLGKYFYQSWQLLLENLNLKGSVSTLMEFVELLLLHSSKRSTSAS